MTDKSQFEAMLEALINEDQETAKEIFHNIVVGKSREIYEELLESDFAAPDEEEDDEADDEAGFPDAEDDSAEDDEEDDSDESPFDMDADDEEEDEDEDGDLQDRVLDLEDALEELKAEFEELMAGEEGEPEHADMFGGEEEDEFGGEEDEFGGEPADDFGGELGDEDEEVKEVHHYHHDGDKSDKEFNEFMEYVNKVALPKHGDNGVQTRSAIASKNDMGGTTANIAKSFSTQTGGTQGGLLNPSTQPQTGKNVNVPGAKSATKLSNVSQQPMRKSGSDTAQNKKSIVGGK